MFATLMGKRISVAAKGLNKRVGSPDRGGISDLRQVLRKKSGSKLPHPHIVIRSVKYSTG